MKFSKYKIIVLTAITLLVMAWLFAWPARVSGDCMEPTIKNGSYVFLNRVSPSMGRYTIGDIVLVKHEDKTWIARIVALGNDVIQIAEGNIVVNGSPLQDSVERIWSGWNYGTYGIDNPLEIPAGHIYVLSDNLSAHHDDSRVWGPISKKSVVGVLW